MGPACILITPADAELVDSLVSRIASSRDGNAFWIADSRPIGGDYSGDERPFVAGVVPFSGSESEFSTIQSVFGFSPVHEVSLGAMCNDDVDWTLLVTIACWLAENASGAIDLCIERPTTGIAGLSVTLQREDCLTTIVSPFALRLMAQAGRATVEK